MSKNLSIVWTKHLDAEDKRADFGDIVRNSTVVLRRLKDIIDEELASLDRKESGESDFEDPNWAYKQAYRNGDRARLYKTRNLLEFME